MPRRAGARTEARAPTAAREPSGVRDRRGARRPPPSAARRSSDIRRVPCTRTRPGDRGHTLRSAAERNPARSPRTGGSPEIHHARTSAAASRTSPSPNERRFRGARARRRRGPSPSVVAVRTVGQAWPRPRHYGRRAMRFSRRIFKWRVSRTASRQKRGHPNQRHASIVAVSFVQPAESIAPGVMSMRSG